MARGNGNLLIYIYIVMGNRGLLIYIYIIVRGIGGASYSPYYIIYEGASLSPYYNIYEGASYSPYYEGDSINKVTRPLIA
jgi:hypothetical protein